MAATTLEKITEEKKTSLLVMRVCAKHYIELIDLLVEQMRVGGKWW